MTQVPGDLRFTKTHEWVRQLDNGLLEIGISDHAQHALGDLVFVEVPQEGRELAVGDACAVVESVKAASDVYAPVAGTVVAGNPALAAAPELVNQDCYGAGWLMRLRPANKDYAATLLAPADYESVLAAEGG
jgi:glycine cleavage system H protein